MLTSDVSRLSTRLSTGNERILLSCHKYARSSSLDKRYERGRHNRAQHAKEEMWAVLRDESRSLTCLTASRACWLLTDKSFLKSSPARQKHLGMMQ